MTDLPETWIERLAGRDAVDLKEEPQLCMEVLEAYTPIGFSLRLEEGSSIRRLEGGVEVEIVAALVPDEERLRDVTGALSRSFNTVEQTAEHDQL
jgi:hypothetical protein